jgi:peptidyl-prolyl cis-trans isomerase D
MFVTIRKHQKWLWMIVIVLVIIAFVVLMDPTYSVTGGRIGGEGGSFGTINGRPIPREELLDTYSEVRLRYRLLTDQWPGDDQASRMWFDPDRLVHERLLLLEKLRQFDVQVDDAAVADWIATVFRDRDTGVFSLDTYRQFVRNVLPLGGLTEDDLKRFARHEVGIQHVLQLGSLSGNLVTPREADAQFRRDHELLSVELAAFSLTNHLAEVIVDREDLLRFFTNRLAQYRTPERVVVSYVRFDIDQFRDEADAQLAQRPELDAQLDARYQQVGPEFFRDSDGNVLPPEAAKDRMKEQERERLAVITARQQAMGFTEQLYELFQQEPEATDLLERLAAARGLRAGITDPFAAHETPIGLDVFRDFTQAAFSIRPELPMATEPIVGDGAVYVIALQERLPSEAPSLESVEPRVAADYRRQEALRIAQERGQDFHEYLTQRLETGDSFQEICQDANVPWIKPPPFSRRTPSVPDLGTDLPFAQLKELAQQLPEGQTSGFVPTNTGGVILHLNARQPVDDAKLQAGLPDYLEQLRQERQREALGEWFRKESQAIVISGLPGFERR